MSVGKLPKLPIYRPKGVWTNVNDVPKQQALIWAYNYYSTATDQTRRFIVNAVAAIFEFQLLQYCSEKCTREGPCPKCGHWEWVSAPITQVQGNDLQGNDVEWKPPFAERYEEEFTLLNHPQIQWMKGPGSLITKEGIRCAVSVILATKADYWADGPIKVEEVVKSDNPEMKNDKILGKHASAMVQSLYPSWNLNDAAQPVLTVGLWTNTCNILSMMGETPLPQTISLWDIELETKLILSPDLKKSFTSYPAGSEELLDFLAAAKDLVTSPLIIYFPKVLDLTVLVRAKESVIQSPFHYHTCAKELGIEQLKEHNIHSVYGRLGVYYLAKAKATNRPPGKFWSVDKIQQSEDYDVEYAEICEAFHGLKATYEESACVLLQALPKNNKNDLEGVLVDFNVPQSEMQKGIIEVKFQ